MRTHREAVDPIPDWWLTTVDLNLEQLGATAVEHLFAALDSRPASGVIRQPCRLVVRDSTGPAPHRGPAGRSVRADEKLAALPGRDPHHAPLATSTPTVVE